MRDALLLIAVCGVFVISSSYGSERMRQQELLHDTRNNDTAAMVKYLEEKVLAVQAHCEKQQQQERMFCYYELMQSPEGSILRDAISITCPRCKVNVEWELEAD